jgi:hypothetical protein
MDLDLSVVGAELVLRNTRPTQKLCAASVAAGRRSD